MTVPFLDLQAGYLELKEEIDAAVARVLQSGWYILGPEVSAFEEEFASYCGADHCIGVGNGLEALHLALLAMGIGPGHEVIVANPHKFALIRASYQKSDRSDAELLARAGRFDPVLLCPVVHRPEEEAADLAFLHARRQLVAARTSLINHVRGALKASGVMLPRWDAHAFHSHAPGSIPAQLAPALLPLVECIAQLSASIREMEKHARTLIEERYPQAKALQQVNGVGPITSLAFVLTLADPHRFNKSRLVGPYLGLTPRQRQSGERSPQLRITKAGDTFLRSLLVQSAHYILGPFGKDSDLRRWGLAHLERGGPNQKKRTVIAVARRLAVLLHHLLVSGEVYAPLFQQGGAAAA